MSQNIPLAIALGVVGSFCFALSAKVQHSAVGEQVEEPHAKTRMNSGQLLQLIKTPSWWVGIALMGVSLVCQVFGLTMAPVSIVQPVGLLAFPWSVILGAKSRGPGSGIAIPTALTVAATAAFVVVMATHASPPTDLNLIPVAIAACVVYVAASVFAWLGSHGPLPWRSLLWASGGALFYGLEAALVKSIIEFSASNVWWRDPMIWGIATALLIGSLLAGLMVQQAYATGPAEVVVASMTVTSPVVAVVFGVVVLSEGALLTPLNGLSLIALGALAIGGVVALTHVHPGEDATGSPEALTAEDGCGELPPESSATDSADQLKR